MIPAIENGFNPKKIQGCAYRYKKKSKSNEASFVGVNKFTTDEETPKNLLKVDSELQRIQIQKTDAVKKQRNNQAVKEKLELLRETARRTEQNLMPPILAAVKEYATLGEICGILRQEFGEYQESIVL